MLPKPLTKASSIPNGFSNPPALWCPALHLHSQILALLDPRGCREGSSTLPHRSLLPDPHPQWDGTGMKLEAGSSTSTQRTRRAQHRRHCRAPQQHPSAPEGGDSSI